MKRELGITISVGVSFNKVFAKLGSDLKKPDATSVIPLDRFREIVWPLPAQEMIFVGPATQRRLNSLCIRTIGDIARQPPEMLQSQLGVHGLHLWRQANGLDDSAVAAAGYRREAKSIGNSTTAPHDLVTDEHVRITLLALSESVATQLREQGFKCRTVQMSVRSTDLTWFERQAQAEIPTSNAKDLLDISLELFRQNRPKTPVRGLGVRVSSLLPAGETEQLSIFPEHIRHMKQHDLETAIDRIRGRYGYEAVRRGVVLFDRALDLDANSVDRPNSFLQRT